MKKNQQETASTVRKRFTPDEDALLGALVERYGQDWHRVSLEMGTRSIRQCRERWRFFLDPDVDHNIWTNEENQLLMEKYKEIGPKWTYLQIFFPKRSYINIRNHFRKLENAEKRKTSPEKMSSQRQNQPQQQQHHNQNELQQLQIKDTKMIRPDIVAQNPQMNMVYARSLPVINNHNSNQCFPVMPMPHMSIVKNQRPAENKNKAVINQSNEKSPQNKIQFPHIWDLVPHFPLAPSII